MDKIDLMEKFELITVQLLSIDLTDEKDAVIQQIEDMLAERESIINRINILDDKSEVPLDDMNRMLGKNLQLETKLQEVMVILEGGLKNVIKEKSLSSVKKKAHRSYLNFKKESNGYFIDKKK